ncbi:MAG: hypothetical protein VB071_11480 [Lawsonibacter sp.]|nr:hypothetical protein [Lawsonibacter sp.]
MTQAITLAAWILCFFVGGLLVTDFIRTELSFKQQKKDTHTEQEVSGYDSQQ